MNFLFYVGIIIPTLITIALFLIFIYCWFLQKARKEVLTKKYDPHGKMRSLGMSMDPPPPPAFCRMADSLLPDNGEDNVAYDVSRSPSTEQDARGRPMYHTYHDSGISAGLSPSQESEPHPCLAYRSCPDSGISGFGQQPAQCSYHASRGYHQVDDSIQRQQQQIYADHMQINMQQQQELYHHQQPQAALHNNLVQASVHPTHGVCYGDNTNHPQSPQHYNPPLLHPASLNLTHYNARQISLVAHVHTPPPEPPASAQRVRLPVCPDNPGHRHHHLNDQQCCHANEVISHTQNIINHAPLGRQGQANAATPVTSDSHISNRPNALSTLSFQPQLGNNSHSSSSSPTKPLRHSNRDNIIANSTQPPAVTSTDRPDSQASQSSTTDSEDSGFRSSHCAALHNARLNKQGNPLLKPLRRTKNNKTKSKLDKNITSNNETSRVNGATPLITLSPQNLQTNVDNCNVIQNMSLMDVDLAHRPSRTVNSNNLSNHKLSQSASPQSGDPVTFHDPSPSRIHQHSPARDNWPPQSTNDEETTVNQNIDLNDISTHLSWKYLQDLSSSNNIYNGAPNGGIIIQPCHQGMKPGQIHQNNQEQHMEMFGFSVV